MKSDTSERGLETIIVTSLVDAAGYILGDPQDYDRDHAVDLTQLLAFLQATQLKAVEQLGLASDGPRRQQFLHRLQGDITRHGVIHVLRNGVKHGPASVDLFYGTPSPGNAQAATRFAANRFSVTRQLRYSKAEAQLALDLCLFINGLPIATFELKNRLTKQTVEDAVQQYKADRDPRELLFQFGRCVVHFAVDDQEVRFCAHLTGKDAWFLPFNKGYHDGAGNPPNPDGLKTDYLWREALTRDGLTDILENYAQVVEEKGDSGKKKVKQVFPRYHQRDVVRKLLADARAHGAGRRYLIQHSAGSGKSNSIAWLAHQLIGLERESAAIFDSVVVVTDRKNLDKQIRDTIKQFAQVAATVGHAEHSGDLRSFLASGKKIIITTVQKFPFILSAIGDEHRGRSFAIIIDEAHSSQGGRTAAQMNIALSEGGGEAEDESTEDTINRIMAGRKMLANASYFAFTATPKNKTLEIFGEPLLHTMYVDKQLSDIKAVQTLSRLNRAHPQKHDTFVLDFMNDSDMIVAAFANYYRTTVLSEATDPNKLHDLQATIMSYGVYTQADVDRLVERYLGGAGRDQLDPILDACVGIYIAELDEDGQVDFKGRAKAFVRTYEFLASILPYSYAAWEKLSIFLNFLIPKLPAPKEEDLAKGMLESIDMDSYRVEVRAALEIAIADQDAMIYPAPTAGGSRIMEAEIDRLSNILKAFNDQFGNVDWRDADKIRQVITEEIPAKVAADKAYQNAMKNSDKQNARIEHDNALQRVIIDLLTDHTELFKQFSDDPSFRRWLGDTIFSATYREQRT